MKGGWKNSRRRSELPPDWDQRRQRTLQRCGWRCEAMSQITDDREIYAEGTRCWRRATDVDHKSDRWDHDDLQGLCELHHQAKTIQEAIAARRKYGPKKRPPERHPGRLK